MPDKTIVQSNLDIDSEDLNELVPYKHRKRLNDQPNKIRNIAKYYPDGTIYEPYMYVLGLGERHFKNFDGEIQRITDKFPWTKKKFIRFIMNELIINTQFSMLRQVVHNVSEGKKSAGYFNVIIYPCNDFFSASIEVQTKDATPIYASASFAPLTSGQAGAVYDSVEYMSQSCDYMEKNVFKDLKRTGILKKDIIMLDGGAVKVFLMPAGTGCIVIKKEVVQ